MRRVRAALLCVLFAIVAWLGYAAWRLAPKPGEPVAGNAAEPRPEAVPVAPAPREALQPARRVVEVAPAPRAVPAVSPDPRSLIIPPEVLAQAREHVRLLGSEDFPEREGAEAALAAMRRLARPALLEAVARDPDPEVRARAARLLPKATEDDLRARLAAFLADVEGRYDHDMPGERTFRDHLGTAPQVRALAAAVLRDPANRDLFAAVEKGAEPGAKALAERRLALYAGMWPQNRTDGRTDIARHPVLEEATAVLVAEIALASVPTTHGGPLRWVDGCEFVPTTPSRHALAGHGPHAAAYRQVVARCIDTRTTPAELHYLNRLLVNELRSFPEAFPALCRVVSTPGVAPAQKCEAMRALAAQYTARQLVPVLLAAIKDEAVVQTVRFPRPDGTAELHPCRVGDVARAFLLFVSGQDVESYGYEYPAIYGPGRLSDTHFIRDGGYALRTEQKRAAAVMKFAWWRLRVSVE